MFALLKWLITAAVLFGVVTIGLAYLSSEALAKLGSETAGLAVKGCRGGQAFMNSFQQQWEKEAVTDAGEIRPSEAVAAAERPAE